MVGPPLESVEATSRIQGATSRIPHLLFHVILFNDINTTHVTLACHMLLAWLLFLIYYVVMLAQGYTPRFLF